MNNLEKYLDQVIEQRPVAYEPPAEVQEPPTGNLLMSARRRWYLVVAVAVLICAVALPAIFFLIEPLYVVRGAVSVKPMVQGILSSEASRGEIGAYSEFVNTQAILLMSNNRWLQTIVDDLAPRNLAFFSGKPQNRIEAILAKLIPGNKLGPEAILREAISSRKITAAPIPRTELLAVTMRSGNVAEARTIVDSFLQNFVVQYAYDATQSDDLNRRRLETQQGELQKRLLAQQQQISNLTQQVGSTAPSQLEQMELSRQTTLLMELTRLEAQRISAQARVGLLEKTEKASVSPDQVVAMRRAHVNSDPMVAELSKNIVAMERDLIARKQSLALGNPALTQSEALLSTFKQNLEDKRKELEQEFDSTLDGRLREAAQRQLEMAAMELEGIKAHYAALDAEVKKQDMKTQQVVRTGGEIEDLRLKLQIDQEMYDTVSRRIKILDMERGRPARVEIAYSPELEATADRRPQLAIATVIGALVCGFGVAFLRDKMDKTLQTPDDVTRHLDLPVLGTTTSSRTIKPALFAEQIAGDYQTIRTNLGLLNDGGMPRKLVVSSAGTREGKTTFAVNLATSLAKSGKKVLLVDGDMRKPDIGLMLNVANGSKGLQDVLLGEDPSSAICVLPSSGLHVLAANPRHLADAYELLTSATAAEQMEKLGREYDHIIIDSPPALAFPDALVWAKLTDAVVLVSFAGQTTAPDLREAKDRFARVRARVLGAVLSNVPVDQSLYRHAYTYRSRGPQSVRKSQKPKKLLLATEDSEDDTGTPKA